ncbi:protein regulator of cytokinesis 1-like isoform X2 [Myripristis murdjan]|uniref:Protein regulator of cytokinesis 1a n=1 Tax=Myripristis murdjan TaxID=586833 RepID=A0A667Z7V4_9TELE|nr:protein regulator of cytokinesis 1-like isoform X2 [Myripristis murdjan]
MRRSEVHAAASVTCLNKALARLKDIWEEIGIPEDQRLQRTDAVQKHIQSLLDMMIAEEEALKRRLLNSIETCHKELKTLCTELQLPPFEEEDGCTILQLEKDSRTRLEVMRKHKQQRMEDLKALLAKDRELCRIMCCTPFGIDQDAVPSLEELKTYRSYLDDLTKEKERRHDEFVGIKSQIIVCMDDLERSPETSFERDVMCEDEDVFCLSTDNIAALRLLLSQLEEHKAENEQCCSAHRTKIQDLWDRLQIPQEEREAFSEHMVKSKKKNRDALEAEVQRLDVLKMKSMKSFIEAIRAEISLFWERCFYSQEQCQAFVSYHDDNFTEELLNLHEAEVLTLKKYYEDHRELFDGVTKWKENWTLFLELDRKANDPSRFNNRGGNLLKEQKQRTDLQKSLPKLEKSLKAQIDLWEQEHGRTFRVDGQTFLEYVQQQWDLHHSEKEKEKVERQMKKSKQTEEDMLYGTSIRTPSKRRMAGTPTPGKVRKLNGTSIASTNSTLTSGFGTICHSVQRTPLSASKGLGLRTPGNGKTPRALDRNKENISHLSRNALSGVLRSQDSSDRNFSINAVGVSYSEFARDITKASGQLNSTISHH